MFCRMVCQPSDPATNTVMVDMCKIGQEQPRLQSVALELMEHHPQHLAEEEEQCVEEEQTAKTEVSEPARLLPETGRTGEEQAPAEEEGRQEEESEVEQRRRLECLKREQRKEARAKREEWETKQSLKVFYKRHGFFGVNEARRSGCGVWSVPTTYPIIVAAELNDERMVRMLLQERADPNQRNSSKQTALQAAAKKNWYGSHEKVLRLLRNVANPSTGGA
mmetsp:Transcript_85227/g.275970  ORF Transcript_85227/g.275970 Transcript_85227/m.275970 type:complete len:221 (+) Transcript_85227:73-735(+)